MSVNPEQKPKGIIRLKEPGQVAVRLRFTGGAVNAEALSAIAELAARYSGGRIHLTTRQGIEIAPVAASMPVTVVEFTLPKPS